MNWKKWFESGVRGSVQIRGSGLQLLDTSFVAVLSASAAPLWQKDPGLITPAQGCHAGAFETSVRS